MNFGRSGYTQTEQLLVLREDVLSFDPDMVALVFFPGNDINDVREETSPEKNRPFFLRSPSGEWILDASFREEPRYRFRQWINGIKQRSVLVSLVGDRCNAYVRNRRHQKQREKEEEEGDDRFLAGNGSLWTEHPDEAMTKSFEVNKALIREMAEICQDRKIRFVLMVLPIESYMPEEEKLLKDINPTFDPNRIEEDLRRYAGTRGIDFIGLQRVFAARYRETGTPLHWIHLNYKGHQLTADILAEKLEEILCTNDKKGKAAGPVASKTRPRKSTGTK